MSRQSLDAFRRKVTVEWPKKQDADAKALLIKTARAGHADIMQEQTARSGIPPDWNAYANRPGNENLDTVILPGPIVFKYRYLREVTLVTLEALERASPVDSGDYARSHTIYLDGVAVADLPEDLSGISDIMISNPVPYARRLEVGKTKSGRSFVIQVEPNIYERTLQQMRSKFHNVAKMTFQFATLPDAWIIRGRASAYTTRRGGAVRKLIGQKVTAPAIVIEAL